MNICLSRPPQEKWGPLSPRGSFLVSASWLPRMQAPTFPVYKYLLSPRHFGNSLGGSLTGCISCTQVHSWRTLLIPQMYPLLSPTPSQPLPSSTLKPSRDAGEQGKIKQVVISSKGGPGRIYTKPGDVLLLPMVPPTVSSGRYQLLHSGCTQVGLLVASRRGRDGCGS